MIPTSSEISDVGLLQQLSARLFDEADSGSFYDAIVATAAAIMQSECASLQLLERDGSRLELLASLGFTPTAREFWHWVDAGSTSTCGITLRSGQRTVVTDTEQLDSPITGDDLAAYREVGIRAVQSTPLCSRNGALVGMISTHWRRVHQPSDRALVLFDILARQVADLLERQGVVRELREREASQRAANVRKDEFLATLAHELRNPLQPIRAGLEVMRLTGARLENFAEVRRAMERQVTHMVRLIDDLFDVARIGSGKVQLRPERACLADLIQSAIDANLDHLESKHIQLLATVPPRSCMVTVDATRFVQIVSNLLHNAAKFSRLNGTIQLMAHTEAGADGQATAVVCSIADDGDGISAEFLPHIFELFVQGAQRAPQMGLGLGLALVHSLVQLHHGRITCVSDGPGCGSLFTFRLPLSPAVPE